MKNRLVVLLPILFFAFPFYGFSQSGYINRPAAIAAGKLVLDPNSDGYTSASTSGFAGDDVNNSEIPFKSVRSYSSEPFGDLRRGPSHLYSDFVPDANSIGYYSYYDGTNLLFRMRMGSVMSGSKGYSVLLDTDGKFGATGTNADPNFQAATTGTNGNPGFEIEVVLETNSRIAIYNVDGASTGTLVKQYTSWQNMSQISVAASNDNGDPDFLIDFYIPFSDLTASPFNLTTSTPIRMSATTVMSPQGAIGGPKSDIYGLNDGAYSSTNAQYEDFINEQPPVSVTNLGSGGTGFGSRCTAAPKITGSVGTGTVTITGSWTKSALTGSSSTATITVYNNGTSIGTIPGVTSGSTWSLPSITVASGNVITARAQAAGESMCLTSNSVTAQGCNTANIPSSSGLAITCLTNRGIEGTFVTTNTVKIYFLDPTTFTSTLVAGPAASSPTFGYNGSNWYYNGTSYNGSNIPSACGGGSPDLTTNGSYYVTTIAPGSTCESAPVFGCLGLSSTTTPILTQTDLYNTTTTLSGTAVAGAQVRLRVNGQLISTTTATGGNYSFSGLTLAVGDAVEIRAIASGNCISAAVSRTVACFTNPPVIDGDNNNQMAASSAITGISGDAAGTLVRVYNSSTNAIVATAIVQSNGTWSTGNASTTPSTYISVAGTGYYAIAQNGTCNASAASAVITAASATSAARCGTITGPVGAAATSVSGTLSGSFTTTTVNLYQDGSLIGSTTTTGTSWGPITVNTTPTNTLYANGSLKIGVQESGKQEVSCPASATSITCSSAPASPVIVSPTNPTIVANQSITYTLSNIVSGNFYGIADGNTGKALANGVWATSNSNLSITTYPFTSAGNYAITVKATSISGVTVCTSTPSAASVTVTGVLPVQFLKVSATPAGADIRVSWTVSNENDVAFYAVERSSDCMHFADAGTIEYRNSNEASKLYQFLDTDAGEGNLCYRIRQVDVDGKAHYSTVVLVRRDGAWTMAAMPNPAHAATSILVSAPTATSAEITLSNTAGQQVTRTALRLQKGSNTVPVDLQKLRPGLYLVKLSSPGKTLYQKIMVQ